MPGQLIAARYVSDPLDGPARSRELVQVRQEVDKAQTAAGVFWRNGVFLLGSRAAVSSQLLDYRMFKLLY